MGLKNSMQGNFSYGSGQNKGQQAIEYNLAKNSGSGAFAANRGAGMPGYDSNGNVKTNANGGWYDTFVAPASGTPGGTPADNTNRYDYKGQTGLDQAGFQAAALADSGPGGDPAMMGYGTGLPGGGKPMQGNQGRAFQRTPTPGLRNVMAGPAPTPVQPGNDIWGGGGDQMQGLESMQQNSGLSPALKALFGM